MLIFIYNKRGTADTEERMVFSTNGDKIIIYPCRKIKSMPSIYSIYNTFS